MPNVYKMLKIGLTLPVTGASPERAFFKLKIMKNRLRSTMGQERLQGLMRITCEKDLTINYENIINTFASKSPLLLKALVLLIKIYFFLSCIIPIMLFIY